MRPPWVDPVLGTGRMREPRARTQTIRFSRGRLRIHAIALSVITAFSSESARAQITSFSSSKTALYHQSNEKEVSSAGFEFSASVTGEKGISEIPSPVLGTPDERTLKLDLTSPQLWSTRTYYEQSEGLEKDFPSGSYRWYLLDREAISLLIGGPELGYPQDVPRVIGGVWESGLLCVVSDEDSVIHFSEFTSYAKGNRMTLSLSDGKETLLSRTFVSGIDKETPSSFSISAKTLSNGQRYTFAIRFESIVDSTTEALPGAEGISSLVNQTTVDILAIPEPSTLGLVGCGLLMLLATGTRRITRRTPAMSPLVR